MSDIYEVRVSYSLYMTPVDGGSKLSRGEILEAAALYHEAGEGVGLTYKAKRLRKVDFHGLPEEVLDSFPWGDVNDMTVREYIEGDA